MIIIGRALKYGDNINTDIISPPQYMEMTIAEAAPHAMSAVDTDFAAKARNSKLLIAGNNFGSGSSRVKRPFSTVATEPQRAMQRPQWPLSLSMPVSGMVPRSKDGRSFAREGRIPAGLGFVTTISQWSVDGAPGTRRPPPCFSLEK